MATLIQFLLRTSFGLAFGMAITSHKKVTSGYFRNHLFVVLGMLSFAMGATVVSDSNWKHAIGFWLPAVAVLISYIGTALWLLQRYQAGKVALWLVSLVSLASALVVSKNADDWNTLTRGLMHLELVASGLMLGLTLAAMLLGHWYLNWPGMELAPLRRLLKWLAAATVLSIVVASTCCALYGTSPKSHTHFWIYFSAMWLLGLLGVLVTTWMAWKTLEIPNTQSATGLLYVSVIGAFTGELAALLLVGMQGFPL